MDRSKGIVVVVLVLLLILTIAVISYYSYTYSNEETARISCSVDFDCVPEKTCHPTSCVSSEYFENSDSPNEACTKECRPGTLDCDQGYCSCVLGVCKANIK